MDLGDIKDFFLSVGEEELRDLAKIGLIRNFLKITALVFFLECIKNFAVSLALFTFIYLFIFEEKRWWALIQAFIIYCVAMLLNPTSILEAIGVYYLVEAGLDIILGAIGLLF